MSSSLRALMRREKAARRGADSSAADAPSKVSAVLRSDDGPTRASAAPAACPPCPPPVDATTPRVLEETFELVSDSDDLEHKDAAVDGAEGSSMLPGMTKGSTDAVFGNAVVNGSPSHLSGSHGRPLVSGDAGSPDADLMDSTAPRHPPSTGDAGGIFSPDGRQHGSDRPRLRQGGTFPSPSRRRSVTQTSESESDQRGMRSNDPPAADATGLPGSSAPGEPLGGLADESHLYDQLNTAFSSRIEYERERILSNVDESAAALDYAAVGGAESTITSANFGKSGVRLSADPSLPDGFFDNKRADVQARGKLLSREVSEKLSELDRSQAELLSEAQYVQDKFVESLRERMRLEQDEQEHHDTLRVLSERVAAIKGALAQGGLPSTDGLPPANAASSPHPDTVVGILGSEEVDDMSWRMKALV
ncbi:zinc finger protein 830 [Babesia caballi]|uniref:Zinc finger protein 830 n=1 Tax=Babesia caballi TaxID=5871 RepID=A0AAV4M2A1_BABCB|nr:zinc finger protein 830 [Babesia caballi]